MGALCGSNANEDEARIQYGEEQRNRARPPIQNPNNRSLSMIGSNSPPVRRPIHNNAKEGLPEGWIARRDPNTGRIFYQNNVLKTTQWDRPEKPPELPQTPALPPGWISIRDPRTGRVYYQNNLTKSTQWERPTSQSTNLEPEELKLNTKVTHEFTKSERDFLGVFKSKSGDIERCDTAVFEYGECAVCFEALYENKPTVMTNGGDSRTCRHFICYECAHDVFENGEKECPLCRTEFQGLQILPDIQKKPQEWFDVCDFDGTGQLRRQELADALTAILPVPQTRINMDLDALWDKWDVSKTGKLSTDEARKFVVPYVTRKVDLPIFQQGNIPDLTNEKSTVKWFDYWDVDANGVIDKYELARGLLKTFGQYMKKKAVRKLINNVLVVTWGAYSENNEIGVKEFTKADGLADTLRALLIQIKMHGPGSDESDAEEHPSMSGEADNKQQQPAQPVQNREPATEPRGLQTDVNSGSSNYFQMPGAAPAEEEKKKEEQPVQKHHGPPQHELGPLGNFSPDELARMDDATLQDVLSQWYRQKDHQDHFHSANDVPPGWVVDV